MLFLLLCICKGKFKVAFQRVLMLVLQFGIRLFKGRNFTPDKGNLAPDFRRGSMVRDHAVKGLNVFGKCHSGTASDASNEWLSNTKNAIQSDKQTSNDTVKVRLQKEPD
jgi:hypothetical protein